MREGDDDREPATPEDPTPSPPARAQVARLLRDDAGRAPRATTIVIGLSVVVALGLFLVRSARRVPGAATPPPPPSAESAPSGGSPAERLDKAMEELQALPAPSQNEGVAKLLAALDGVARSTVGFKLPDGRDTPPLPADAPRVVRFGVVLVKYRGAQLSPESAPPREVALERARKLVSLARDDFAAAVKAGDPGSFGDIGTVKRGVLEAGTEYVLFTLPIGFVSEVLDTPRGFWIAKRLK
jgi:hypothetical protein